MTFTHHIIRAALLVAAIVATAVPVQGRAQAMNHSKMDHSKMQVPAAQNAPVEADKTINLCLRGNDDAGTECADTPQQPRTSIPPVTAADRAAAFPPVAGHAVHDNGIYSRVLLNRLEVWDAKPGAGQQWEGQAWIGTDLNRLWLRSEGERVDGITEAADLEVLYGRSVARWWDVVAGVRHDFKPGASQDHLAVGVMGLAPYKFEVQATAYLGSGGQASARLEAEYDTLFTNRLILQSLVEANFHGRDDARRGIGSGLSTLEAGLRLRYEFTRQFAPYIGIVHERAYGRTARMHREAGEGQSDTRLVAGLRVWF